MDANVFAQAREQYLALPIEQQAQYLNILIQIHGQDWVDCFTKYLEEGNFSEFETNIAKLDLGPVTEGGTTLAENYDRTKEDVVESMAEEDQSCPIAELVETMGEEYRALPEEKQEGMLESLKNAKGEEFSEAIAIAFSNKDFCEYIANETQSFFDTLAYSFSQSDNKKAILSNVSMNFSEGVSNSILDYISGKMPKNFSVLETVGLISAVARRNFSENGELADALQELSDGALTPPEAETMATNVQATAPEAVEPLKEGANVDNAVEAGVAAEGTVGVNPAPHEDFDDGGAAPVASDVSQIGTDTAVREKEQNNLLIDALVEKLKALQTQDAKDALIADIRLVLPGETVDYIIARAQGEDFSEEVPNEAEQAISEQPTEEEVAAATPDQNRYEQMAGQLLGPDAYTTSPVASVTTSQAPIATATLPEGLPVSEGGTTLAEDYQRDNIIDQYQKLGLI